MLMFLNISIRI